MAKIVDGLQLEDLVNGGAVFETEQGEDTPDTDHKDEVKSAEYIDAVKEFLNLDCLDQGNSTEETVLEPFTLMASKMTNLIPSGKIKKRILREGCGMKPQPGCVVKIHYNAYTEHEALPFDSTYARKKPFSFEVGQGGVIEGLEIAIQSMRNTEKALFLISPELAYKDSGLDRIPPNSTVLFEVEMGDIVLTQSDQPLEIKDFDSVYKYSLALCVKSKKMFQLCDYSGAAKDYSLAAHKMEDVVLNDMEDQQKSTDLLLKIYTNLLICHVHLQIPKKGCYYANKIFDIAKAENIQVSAKVYFNNAKCLKMLGDYDLAMRRLKQAQKIIPRNPEILQAVVELERCKEENKKRDKALGKALLSG